MAAQIHLRLLADETGLRASWLRLQDRQLSAAIKHGDLSAAAADIGSAQAIVYVPGQDVLLTRVNLPDSRRKQLLSALPYALEDALIDDIDDLHCALGPKLTAGVYAAAVVTHEKMEFWRTALNDAGIHAQRMLPDTLLPPIDEESWSIVCENGQSPMHTLVRTGPALGFACHPLSLPLLLHKTLAEQAESPPARVRLFNCQALDRAALESTVSPSCELEWRENDVPEQALGLVAEGLSPTGINLLQGRYAPRSRLKRQLRPWYPAAALAAVWLVMGLGSTIAEYLSISRQEDALKEQIVKVFRQTFPEVKRVVNPQAQMRHHLNKLRGHGGGGPSFAEMLGTIGPLTRSAQKLHIQHMRYQQGQIELLLELPDLQTLEAFKQTLVDNTPWQVELKSANASENKVQGRILVYQKS